MGPGVDDDDDDSCHGLGQSCTSRAQYVSANCVVFTHYSGDAAAVVDQHFSRALDKNSPSHGKGKFVLEFNIYSKFALLVRFVKLPA